MDQENNLDIAIIGMSARFPGAKNLDAFWENLKSGKESIRFFTDDELADYHSVNDPEYVKAAPVLDDIDKFDASFFGYAPREAQMMDPQHRLLLECAASALEHAGYASESYEGLISVFAGSAMNTYLLFSGLAPQYIDEYLPTLIGNDKDFLATRISYKLNLKGPSVTVQTACSTALVATHMACQSLLNGESDIALAGAVSVRVPHNAGHQYVQGSVFTPDGHCRPFDKKANGTIFGSGVGIVVLKRLEYALEDGDYIHGIIKGSAINNDGASKVDYTAPSVESQSEAIAEALGVAGVDASTISYVEAHGTGTAIGDPIEVAALTKAFSSYTNQKQFCALGSVKSNVGHLDVAAGMAGLIKTILALKHKQLPATLHYTEPNPEIKFAQTPFYVNDSLRQWNPEAGIRRAGISALGIGGTNAHVILEEAPSIQQTSSITSPQLLIWSAKTEESLNETTLNLKTHLTERPDTSLSDVAYTLQRGRNVFHHKRFLIASTLSEAIEILDGNQPDLIQESVQKAVSREIVFMFPGQGAQYVNMGKDLYETEDVFRNAIDTCASILSPILSIDIRTLLYPEPGALESASDQLTQTSYTQPALFMVSYAVAKLLKSWGIDAEAYIGHSIGEYVAACLSGVFSLEDGLRIVAARGRFMQGMPSGSMLAVSLPETEVQLYLKDGVSLAAINGAELCVLSGPRDAISSLEATLSSKGIESRSLRTSHGFHSSMMQPAANTFRDYLSQVTLSPPQKPFISNLTGTWITTEEATSTQYWADQLRNAVQFEKGLEELLQDPNRIFVEVGPGRTLCSLLKMHRERQEEHTAIATLRHPKLEESDQRFILKCIGQLWLNGIHPDWPSFHKKTGSRRIPLPTYPFAREPHWFEPAQEQTTSPYIYPKSKPQRKSLLYTPGWKRISIASTNRTRTPSTWLLFIDSSPFSQQCLQILQAEGNTVLTVQTGPEFKSLSSTAWTINPKERAQYDQLLQRIKEAGFLPDFILHTWNTTGYHTLEDNLSTNTYERSLEKSFFSLLYLSQALQQKEYVHPMTLSVLTTNAHDVLGTEQVAPFHATLHGPCRVIEREFPNVQCVHIDLALDIQPPTQPSTQSILNYIESTPQYSMLALRGKHFWVPEFTPLSQSVSPDNLALKDNGVYLITGGLGGLGLAFASWIAKQCRSTLLLLGRSPLPAKTKWASVLADNTSDQRLKSRIQSIQHLESLGAQVELIQADVTNLHEVTNAIDRAQNTYGLLNGVIHTAGIIEDTLIPLKTKESASRVLAPKILGTLVLSQVLKSSQLDFLVLCSSINAYLSPAGQFDYTAANGFQDAFSYAYRQSTGTNTIAINWPGWQETGMLAAKKEAFANQPWFKKEFERSIKTGEGLEALQQALSIAQPQLIVSKKDINIDEEKEPAVTGSTTKQLPTHSNGIEQISSSGNVPSEDPLESQLQTIWSQVLGLKNIGVNDDFFELGGHSLLAVTLFKKMEQSLGALHLPISALIQAPSIAKFAPLIEPKTVTANDWSPLVLIQSGSSDIPLFCIHGAGGNILIYRELAAQLGPQYTVYGLESQGLDGKQPLLPTISDMASQYVQEIKKVHPGGPYMLLGYCMGGTIALEMAQQLKTQGHDVPFLGLLETYNWVNLKKDNPINKARHLLQKIEFHTRNVLLLPGKERKLFLQDKLNTLKRRRKLWLGMRKKATKSAEDIQEGLHHTTLAKIWENNDDAALVYNPSFYEGRLTHFRPQQEYAIYSGSNMRFDTVAQQVETRILPVYPAGMMVPPFVSLLAEEIRRRTEATILARTQKEETSEIAT